MFAVFYVLGTCLASLWSPPFPLHVPSLILPLSRQDTAIAHLDFLPSYDLVLWTESSVPFPFGNGGSGVFANCSLCGTVAALSFSARRVCSCFSGEVCAILHALCWSWQHQQVCHFSPPILLSFCPLFSIYLNLSGRSGRNCLLCSVRL